MIFLDMKTIVFSNVITDIVCLLVMIRLWRQNRDRFAGTGFFVFDFALQTTALLLIILRGQIPAWISCVAANTMIVTGAFLGYVGLEYFLDKKSSQLHNYILLAAFAFIHTWFTFVQSDQAVRNVNLAVGLLIICWQCTWLLLRRVEPEKRQLTWGMGIIFGLYCLVSIIRIVEFIIDPQTNSNYLQAGIFEQLVLISYQMLFIFLTYGLVLMFNKRLMMEITTQEEKFSKAFHSSPYAVAITRLSDGLIIEVNEGFLNITGYQREELLGKTSLDMHLWYTDEDRSLIVNELTNKGSVCKKEIPFRKRTGEMIIGLYSADIITINNGKCLLSSINDITERKRMEAQIRAQMKELRAFYNLSELIERKGITLDEIYEEFAKMLPASWQYSEVACARIVIGDKEFRTNNFAESRWMQSAPVMVNETAAGKIEVGYLEERPEHDEGPFLKEERLLINALAERLGHITERKHLEIEVKESERKYRNLYYYAQVGLFETSMEEAKIVACNQYYCDLAGFPDVESAIGMDVLQLYVNPDDREEVKKVLQTRGYLRNHLLQLKNRLTGKIFWVEFSARLNPSRHIIEGSLIDITERKLMDEKLYMSEERFRLLSEASFEGIVVHDEGVLLNANDQYFKMFGYEPGEALGKEMISVTIAPESLEFVKKQIATGGLDPYESIGLRKDGTRFPIEIRNRKTEYNGRIVRVGAIRDITERKRAEEEVQMLNVELEKKVADRTRELHESQLALMNLVDDLNQSAKKTDLINRKLEETNKELAAFSYSVSHDLRAPLRSIDGFSLALLEDYQEKLDETGRHYLSKIRAATQHMGSLIEDMLKLSRITHAEFHHESIDLSKIVQSITDTLRQSNPAKDVRVNIQKDIVVHGDRNFMEIAMTNLLENAWKFTGKQSNPLIEFGMNLTERGKIFFVRDNGVGFDMAYVNKLFGAFQRLHGQNEFPGTGIGLATVKRIITRHGGQIWAEGEAGKGATFLFTLPE